MSAFKARSPLEGTTRHNIRWTRSQDSQVFMMEKRPLPVGRIDVSPPRNHTLLLVEEGASEDADVTALRHAVDNLKRDLETERKQRIEEVDYLNKRLLDLERARKRRNEDLYHPLFASRELAIVSLLQRQRDMLDDLVFKEIEAKSQEVQKDPNLRNRRERKEARKRFLKKFGENHTMSYFKLIKAYENSQGSGQIYSEILALAEQKFLDEYGSKGFEHEDSVNVRSSMQALRSAKNYRDRNAGHIFDFKYMEKGRQSLQQERKAWKMQAVVLLNLQNAVKEDWLYGDFKTLGNPATGTLLLEIARKIEELENKSGFAIKDLAQMP